MKSLDGIANYISKKLLEQGFIIHRYNSYTTNSIYLKLDYGAMNSIRISDHTGKQYLSYRYNISSEYKISKWKKDDKGYWKYYCPTKFNEVNKLIELIMSSKMEKKTRYNYNELMQEYKNKKENSVGFWEQAWEVKL